MTDQERIAVEGRVKNALQQIRPYLQQDGGDVEYVDITNQGVVMVLKQGIETAIKRAIPEVKAVERV